jgi:hypothetical protein
MSKDLKDLGVQVQSITMFDKLTASSLLPTAIPALLDSSFPYIWLPLESCLFFERAFGLTWDSSTQLYLVNESLHDALVLQNATLVFTLSNINGSSVNITFPYAAFDLTASSPLVPNTTRYFPLKRAANTTQYVLGRTFFQEAYVVADYDRGNFSVFQCNWAKSEETIVPILPVGLPEGSPIAIEMIGSIGGLVGIGLIYGLIYWCTIDTPHLRRRPVTTEQRKLSPDVTHGWFKPELHNDEIHPAQELEGQRCRWIEEAEANEAHIFEMSAVEDVAAELRSPDGAVEMAVPTSELAASGDPVITSTKSASHFLEEEKVKSEVISQAGDSLDGESEPVSPLSPVPGQSLTSMPDLLARLST